MKNNNLIGAFLALTGILCLNFSAKAQFPGGMEEAPQPLGWDDTFYGKPVVPFKMVTPGGQTLNSDALKGKIIVLDFWATWCKPCHLLTHELDSALKKYSSDQVLLIGVNHQEEKIKGGNPLQYWKDKGYQFPMTLHNDDYGKAVNAGFPSVMVVDREGIVAGNFSSWTPTRAGEVDILIWEMLEKPKADRTEFMKLLRLGEPLKALYIYEKLIKAHPGLKAELQQEHLYATFLTSPWDGVNLSKSWIKGAGETEEVLFTIGKFIVASKTTEQGVNEYGVGVLKTLMAKYPAYRSNKEVSAFLLSLAKRINEAAVVHSSH